MGAFIDSYVAFDSGRPRSLDRAFTTQAARHAEFNVNLAHVEATLTAPRVRGRLAVQAGTSVQVNYAGEPRVGGTSGPELARVLQEAYAGYELRRGLWIDAGVFFSNVGMEGWISRDNPTYTRSLVADYSPYYSSGARLTWQAASSLALRVDVVNGWQTISENNEDKTLGVRIDQSLGHASTVSWYGLAGREAAGQLRFFNGVGVRTRPTERVEITAQIDVGREGAPDTVGTTAPARVWHGGMVIVRWMMTPRAALVARGERYADPQQVVAVTGTPTGLRATGGSLGLDIHPLPQLLWRSELRTLSNRGAVFPDRRREAGVSSRNTVVVTSLAVSF